MTASLFFFSCSKPTQPPIPSANTAPQLVKKVSWNVIVTQYLNFTYNADSTVQKMVSGSSNLAWQYTSLFNYETKRLKETIFEVNDVTAFSYNTQGKISVVSNSNQGKETSRDTYTYNAQGQLEHSETLLAFFGGPLKKSWEADYMYDASGKLTQSVSKSYDENSAHTGTITHQYQSFSPELYINPHSLLHPVYQHQVHAVFNMAFLSNTKYLPVKIAESGRAGTGPVMFEYEYTTTGKRIDKLRCKVQINQAAPYYTNEAIFSY